MNIPRDEGYGRLTEIQVKSVDTSKSKIEKAKESVSQSIRNVEGVKVGAVNLNERVNKLIPNINTTLSALKSSSGGEKKLTDAQKKILSDAKQNFKEFKEERSKIEKELKILKKDAGKAESKMRAKYGKLDGSSKKSRFV